MMIFTHRVCVFRDLLDYHSIGAIRGAGTCGAVCRRGEFEFASFERRSPELVEVCDDGSAVPPARYSWATSYCRDRLRVEAYIPIGCRALQQGIGRLRESWWHRYSHEQLFGQGIVRDAIWSREVSILVNADPAEFND